MHSMMKETTLNWWALYYDKNEFWDKDISSQF